MSINSNNLPLPFQQINAKKPLFKNQISSNQTKERLDAFELLFFPKHFDLSPRPISKCPLTNEESTRKRIYFDKTRNMPETDKRKYRAETDLREIQKSKYESKAKNIEKPNGDDNNVDETKLFCTHHLIGRCNLTSCVRMHQIRLPRLFGVCKFYLTDTCAKGDLCEYMHSDFPCRYFYLDMDHPRQLNALNCRFSHGGPLNKNLSKNFLKSIEVFAKDLTKNKPDQFQKTFFAFVEKFEAKQSKLRFENGQCLTNESENYLKSTSNLTQTQHDALIRNGIISLANIDKIPIEKLMECGLTMDQIFELTVTENKIDFDVHAEAIDIIKMNENKIEASKADKLDETNVSINEKMNQSTSDVLAEPQLEQCLMSYGFLDDFEMSDISCVSATDMSWVTATDMSCASGNSSNRNSSSDENDLVIYEDEGSF